nr:immunoglobulin light chain junction region [Macaca mulatta]MPN92202.1 immunoglobulin light chain junction region [Macaca mulatta]
WLQGYSPPYSF